MENNIYQKLGITPMINAAGTYTMVGGSRMSEKTLKDMADASRAHVDIKELQAKANGRLAEPGNADDMFQQMAHLIDHLDSYDSNIIRKDFENRYSKRIVCDKILNVYEHAIESYGKK